MRIQTACSYRA